MHLALNKNEIIDSIKWIYNIWPTKPIDFIKAIKCVAKDFWRRKKSPSIISNAVHLKNAIQWLSLAQDVCNDGGVSIRYSIIPICNWHPGGWQPSYPETTGYIIPTFLNYSNFTGDDSFRVNAIKMANWLLTVQKPDGSIKGGNVQSKMGSQVFDTGQIIFGLLGTYRITKQKKFIDAAIKAGDWLVGCQSEGGYWESHSFNSIPHCYYSRVAWALLELYRIVQEEKYLISARKKLEWVLSHQNSNGWFENSGFTTIQHQEPLTHTIAYTIRGILECGIILNEDKYLSSAISSIKAIAGTIRSTGFVPGTFNCRWLTSSNFSCLTGNAQLSIVFLKVHEITNEPTFLSSGMKINSYLKHVQNFEAKNISIKGAIPGSSPIWGKYEPFAYPNWATKFFADALMMEETMDNANQRSLICHYAG